jgi:nucleoside-diphosphate-sugar epimerase
MLDGRSVIPLAYCGLSRFHTSAVANIAALIGTVLDRPGTRILNIGDPQALSVQEIGSAIGRRMNYGGELRPLDVGDENGNAPVGETPWSAPAPFTLDMTAAAALGYRPKADYIDAVGAVCDWLVSQKDRDWREQFPVMAGYPRDPFDYLAEDRFLATAP